MACERVLGETGIGEMVLCLLLSTVVLDDLEVGLKVRVSVVNFEKMKINNWVSDAL